VQDKPNQAKRKLASRTALTDDAPALAVQPRFITKANSEAVTGLEFRRWKSHFPALIRRVGRKDVLVAADLERAVQDGLKRALETPEAEAKLDAAAKVRELLRNCASVRRAGGR